MATSKTLDILITTTQVVPDILKTLAVTTGTNVKRCGKKEEYLTPN